MVYAIYLKGGSIGEINASLPRSNVSAQIAGVPPTIGKYRFDSLVMGSLEEAQAKVRRYNSYLSPGEKSYYMMHYKLFVL